MEENSKEGKVKFRHMIALVNMGIVSFASGSDIL